MTTNKAELYGWVFTYNPHTGNYRACDRDGLNEFFSSPEKNFLRSKNLETLQELIIKYGGNKELINAIIKL